MLVAPEVCKMGISRDPSCLSIGSVDTLTPSSSASSERSLVSLQCSCREPLEPSPKSGELRRRRYIVPSDPCCDVGQTDVIDGELQAVIVVQTVFSPKNREPRKLQSIRTLRHEETDIVVQGPLQQRGFLHTWHWRWCVLDDRELRIYADEDTFLLDPDRSAQRYSLQHLKVAADAQQTSTLAITDSMDSNLALFLRGGSGIRVEEVVSAALWHQSLLRLHG